MTAGTDRTWLRFLAAFADDLARPIGDDAPIEYIPTQVATEFVRDRLQTAEGCPFNAIRDRSAVDEPEGVCWVVFAEQADCGEIDDGADRVLVLDPTSVGRNDL